MGSVNPAPAAGLEENEAAGVQTLLRQLRHDRAKAVPVIGAGLVIEAGAPSSMDLITHLVGAANRDLPEGLHLFEVADQLEEEFGVSWVQEQVAEAVRTRTPGPTPTLMALTHVPSGVIVTTNYDLAAEISAERAGLVPRTFLLERANEALQKPEEGTVHVLHVHGVPDAPETIILSRSTYERAQSDEVLQYSLRHIASQYQLVFLGHSLDPREVPLRRDLMWSAEAFAQTGPHYLVMPAGELAAERESFFENTTVRSVTFVDPSGSYQPVRWVAQVIGGSSALAQHEFVPPIGEGLIDPFYAQVPLARAEEVGSREERQAWEYTSRMKGGSEVTVEEIDELDRALLVAEGGHGKTQMLYRLGQNDSDHRPLYLPLGTVSPPHEGEDPVPVFIQWMAEARTFTERVPRLTAASLRDDVYTFLLDGLDQVEIATRRPVVETIIEVARLNPQHRYVLASRRVVELDDLKIGGFEKFELVPRDDWLIGYAENRGLSGDQLDELTDAVPAIGDLLKIPIFGAAAVELVIGGQTLPETALELVEVLADKGMEMDEPRFRADVQAVRRWLDRIALAMELWGISEIDRSRLLSSGLETDLDIGATEELLEQLITRTLLGEAGNKVRFPANVIQEARAARGVLRFEGGLDFLKKHVLLEIDGERGIRPPWIHTIDLLLTAAPNDWREEIGRYDALAAARSVSPNEVEGTRAEAIEGIWDWYLGTKIWIPKDRGGELVDDLSAIRRLASQGIPQDLLDKVRSGTRSEHEIVRGNAISVMGVLHDVDGARGAIRDLIRDENSVVRRHAAVVAADLDLVDVLPALNEQLEREDDELAEETIASSVIELLPDGELGDFVLARSEGPRAWRLWSSLDQRWDRLRQLEFLARPGGFSQSWFSHLLEHHEAWSEPEVRLVARVAFRSAERLSYIAPLRKVLEVHPLAALEEGFAAAERAADVRELWFLLWSVPESALRSLADNVANDEVRSALEEFLQARQTPPRAREEIPEQPSPPTLQELLADGAIAEVLARPLVHEIAELNDEDREELRQLIQRSWEEWEVHHGPLIEAVQRDGDRVTISRRVLGILQHAGGLRLPFDYEQWLGVLQLDLRVQDEREWLRESFRADWFDRLETDITSLSTSVLEELVSILRIPWPGRLGLIIGERILSEDASGYAREACLNAIIESDQSDVVRELATWHDDLSISAALVRIGDCDAEEKLLRRLREGENVMPGFLAARHSHWLNYVRCGSSVELLTGAIRDVYVKSERESQIELLYRALNRASGQDALGVYEELMADEDLPGSTFFWYPRTTFLKELLEQGAKDTLPDSLAGTAEYVVDLL